MNTNETKTIVLAKLEGREIVRKRGRADIGELHQFETVYFPVSCIWLNEGTEEDTVKAWEYARREGYNVFTYSTRVDDPLTQAKTDIYGSADWTNLPRF